MKTALIIGAGPAGLTAALELARRSNIRPIVLEALDDVGGISRTIEFKGNRMDLGGHRFFSKSDWVMDWWQALMPVAATPADDSATTASQEAQLLVRNRVSRIYFLRRFFDYPISLSARTIANLGMWRLTRIGISYFYARLFQRKPEENLEDFFHNRFGGELYRTFFKDYTEKVWGVPCREISPAWGAQRVKGLSVGKALLHAAKALLGMLKPDIRQKKTETSLIERFLYPRLGPGQMWRLAADEVRQRGGEIHFGQTIVRIVRDGERIVGVETADAVQRRRIWHGDALISSMAVKDFIAALDPPAPQTVRQIADGLAYRSLITVGILAKKLKPRPESSPPLNLLPDTWLYIQEPGVKLGRLQIFNNWSPALVKTEDTVWLGLEYFCQEGDDLWTMPDNQFARFAGAELAEIGLIDPADVLDAHVVHVPKAYPAYFGTYAQFATIREFADRIENLFLVGRNGMHRYNNQDHSMLTAKLAVDAILAGSCEKSALWSVNLEDDYHETKSSSD